VRPELRVRYRCGAVGICVTKCTQDARAVSQRHRRYVCSVLSNLYYPRP
jgi:hypothetical protein